MVKQRIPIPSDIAAEILFLSDRTCCVCNERGKKVQIHHIDEDPSNNNIENLAVLCFDCHDKTMVQGGFGRKLDASQVTRFRNDWIERVKNRKEKADEIASIQTLTGTTTENVIENQIFDGNLNYSTNNDPDLLKDYLEKIPEARQTELKKAQEKWDSGVTATMNQGNYDMIDFYEEVLIELASFYPKGHFNNNHPKKYFSEIISNKFLLYRLILEPNGQGTGGTMVSTMVGGKVLEDLKNLVVEMVNVLSFHYDFNFNDWKKKWLK